MSKQAIIYCRVSTPEQAKEGVSLDAQERLCRNHCEKEGWDVKEIFIEEGESGRTDNRTQFQKMLKYASLFSKQIDYLVVYKIDRLSRDLHNYGETKLLLKALGINLVSITENFEDTATGKFIENVMAAKAQLESDQNGERTTSGMIEALLQGRYIFNPPYGYRRIGTRKSASIEPIPEMKDKIRQIYIELSKGIKSREEIRQLAYKIGLTRSNGKMLAKSHFYKLLRNPVYKGYLDVPRMGVNQKGTFEYIVEPELFDTVQLILEGKKKKLPIYKKINSDFPLRGTIKHTCGNYMTANWAKEKGRFGHYRCTKCQKTNLDKFKAEVNFQHYLEDIKLDNRISDVIVEAIKINWKIRSRELQNKISELEKQERIKLEEQEKIFAKNLEGTLTDNITKRLLDKTEIELSEIRFEKSNYANPSSDTTELVSYSVNLLSNMTEVWDKMDIYQKNKLQKFIFPDGLLYDGKEFRTDIKPLTVQINESLSAENSMMVTSRRIELRLQD